jgi:hypothetical protein
LEHLISHDEVVLLPDVGHVVPFDYHLVSVGVQVDLDHLQLVIARLDDIVHVEANALENAGELEHGVVKELLRRLLLRER